MTGYSRFDGQSWMPPIRLTQTTLWQLSPDVAVDTSGLLHVAMENFISQPPPHIISYINSTPDPDPPQPPTQLTAEALHNLVILKWRTSASADCNGTLIRYRTDTWPSGPQDGTLVVDRRNQPSVNESFSHAAVSGTTCYYAAFAYDESFNCSAPALVSAMPFVPPDSDRDGDVDQIDFGRFQACLTGPAMPQAEPACQWARLDGDEDVDQNDFAVFQACLSGANVTANANCVP